MSTVNSKNYEYANRMLTRYDVNKDGALTVDEWDKMMIKPTPADANSDGRITSPNTRLGWILVPPNKLRLVGRITLH